MIVLKRHSILVFLFCIAMLAAIIMGRISRLSRVSNAHIEVPGLLSHYIMTDKDNNEECRLVMRRKSSPDRGRPDPRGSKWNLVRSGFEQGIGSEYFFLSSGKNGHMFFIPCRYVQDREFPFFAGIVERENPQLEVSGAEWTNLYLNRMYMGFYLRVPLPFDPSGKNGRAGPRRELIEVLRDSAFIVDTSFDSNSRLFADVISAGIVPELMIQDYHDSLSALLTENPAYSFLLGYENDNPERPVAVFYPLPFSLAQVYEKVNGQQALPVSDERFFPWVESVLSSFKTTPGVSRGRLRNKYRDEYDEYMGMLDEAEKRHEHVNRTKR